MIVVFICLALVLPAGIPSQDRLLGATCQDAAAQGHRSRSSDGSLPGIPPDPDALLLTGRVVRLLDLAETGRTLLGIDWPAGHEPIEQQADARLTQFILSEQREALSHRTRRSIT